MGGPRGTAGEATLGAIDVALGLRGKGGGIEGRGQGRGRRKKPGRIRRRAESIQMASGEFEQSILS